MVINYNSYKFVTFLQTIMEKQHLDTIIDNIFSVNPIKFKSLVKFKYKKTHLTLGSHLLLMTLRKNGMLSMTEIGKLLSMPKPNVTALVDKLIMDKLIERLPDKQDRRIIHIQLTKTGNKFIETMKDSLRNNMKEKLLVLSDKELLQLSASLQNVKKILSKINVND